MILDLALAFLAGFISCASTCVLPLVPAYIAYMGGQATLSAGQPSPGQQARLLGKAALFVAGLLSRERDLVLAMMPAVLLTSSLASHAAAVPGWSPLAIAADWLHFMATTAWLGGLASMVFVLPAVFTVTVR